MITTTSPFNIKKLQKFKRRILSILQRFEEVLNNKQIKENTRPYIDNINFLIHDIQQSLPSDTKFANTFAEKVYQPYDNNTFMMRLGYHIVIKYLPLSTSIDMINQFIYNTCSIAKDEKTTKHKVLVEANVINKTDNKSTYTDTKLSDDKSFLEYIEDIINYMKKTVRLNQPSDEDAACYIYNMFIKQMNYLKKITNKVPDDALPKIIHSCKYAADLVNVPTKTNKNISTTFNVKVVKRKMKDLHKGVRKGIPTPKHLARLITIIRSTLSAFANTLKDDEIKNVVDIFVKHLVSDVHLNECIDKLRIETTVCSKNFQINNDSFKLLNDVFSIIRGFS